jgi:putative ABC transport system ATP-binding protein
VTAQVRIESLVKQYGTLRALNGISFHIQAGEWVALMGPSGSGKTTLINILGGLDTLTSGHVIVDGVDLAKLSENDLVRYRAEKIGFVFQQFHLVPYLSALENVMLAQYFHSVTDEPQAAEALNRVGLGHRLTHLPSQLSGGEQQRVAIARALINQPKLILADEPTGNLDEANEEIVLGLFRELHSAGHTILMVTHDPDIAQQADRKIELVHGHLAVDQRISWTTAFTSTTSSNRSGFAAKKAAPRTSSTFAPPAVWIPCAPSRAWKTYAWYRSSKSTWFN